MIKDFIKSFVGNIEETQGQWLKFKSIKVLARDL